jgi:membrane protease YdiL (CAAX protease family)
MEENIGEEGLNNPLNYRSGIRKYTPEAQVMIWFGIFFACFFFAQLISGGIIIGYYHSVDIRQIASNLGDLNMLRLGQIAATVLGFLLPALIFSYLKDSPVTKYAHANKGFPLALLLIIPLLIISIYPLIDVSYFINQLMPWSTWMQGSQAEYKVIVDALLNDTSIPVFLLNFITVAALPAICEEWIFRGTLQRILSEKWNIHIAIMLSAVFFSAIHFEFSGFLPRILLGVFLGYLFYYSGSLWVNILAHLLNNGAQVVVIYFSKIGLYKGDLDTPEMPGTMELIGFTAGFMILSYLFYRLTQMKKQ